MGTMKLKKGRFARFPIILFTVALPLLFLHSFRIVFADPPHAYDDTYPNAFEDTVLVVLADEGLLKNDHDATGGEAFLETTVPTGTGTIDLATSGAFTYTPSLNFNGVITFSYHFTKTGQFYNVANVTITVTAVNDAPIARDDNNATDEDTILIVSPDGVLSNDDDVDGDPLFVDYFDAMSSNEATVTVTLNGGYTYDPTTSLTLNELAHGEIITDTFTYTISDSGGLTDTAVVSITVTGLNDAPLLNTSGSPTLDNINEDETNSSGMLVSDILSFAGGDPITDVDNGAVEGIAVTGITNDNGIWQYRLNGDSWQPFGAVSDNNALLLDTADYIRFVPNADYNGSAGTISFRAWDQTAGVSGGSANVAPNGGTTPYSTAVETATLTVNPVNDAPVLDNSVVMTLTSIDEDQTTNGDTVEVIVENRITDVDSGAQEGIAVTGVQNSGGTWQYLADSESIWSNFNIPSASATLLGPQSRIRFVPQLHYFGQAGAINFRAWDLTSGSVGQTVAVAQTGGTTAFSTAVATATLTINPVNDQPFLDLNGGSSGVNYNTTFTEDGAPVRIVSTDLFVTDVDNTTLASAQAVLTNPLDGTAESLAVTEGMGITAVYNPTTGILSLTGTASLTSYQTVLRTLTYNNTSQNPHTTDRSVNITVTDGVDDSNTATSVVTVVAVNDSPVLVNSGPWPVNQGSTAPIPAGYLLVTDLDNSPSAIVYTLITLPAHGDLLLSSLPLAVNDTFTQADINNDILRYSNDGAEFSSDSFKFIVADGSGGFIGVTTFNILVNVDNFTPVLAVNAGLTINEGAAGLITSSHLLVTDVDNTAAELTYRLVEAPLHGNLLLNNVPLAKDGTFTQADVNAAKVAYAHDGSETTSDEFPFAVSDGVGGTINGISFAITINPVNDAPTVDLNGAAAGLNFAADFTEGGGAVAIVAGTLSVSDPDNTNLVGATAVLVNRPDGTAESLSVNTGGTGILASYNPSTGILSLAGLNTVNNYQTVLRSLKYNNTSQNPTTTNRIVNVTVHDGSLNSSAAASTITIHPVNDPPVLLTNAALTVDYGQTGAINGSLLKLTDVDNTAADLVYTVKSLPANGQIRLNGIPLTLDGTFTQANINDGLLTYTHNKTNTESDSFQFTAVDGSGGSISQKTFAIVIHPQPVVYLPVILNNYIYSEPNDFACQAFDITFNTSYQFLPDDQEDWYKFSLNVVSNVTVQISSYTPADGQMIVYSSTNCGAVTQIKQASDITPGNTLVLNGLAAGTYYVRVYTAVPPSNPTPYTLRVVKP